MTGGIYKMHVSDNICLRAVSWVFAQANIYLALMQFHGFSARIKFIYSLSVSTILCKLRGSYLQPSTVNSHLSTAQGPMCS